MRLIGEIKELYRYPVKSFQGERIESSRVETYGFYGDRAYCFLDHSRSDKHLSAKQVPGLLGYSAKYTGKLSADGLPEIEVISSDGRQFSWNKELWQEIENLSGRALSPEEFAPGHEGLPAFDDATILLATDLSLQQLGERVGTEADIRQFRPNIVLHHDGLVPFEEFEWLGKTVKIGEVELRISKRCERCSMVNVVPEQVTVDTRFLKKLGEQWDACFGVYAEVVKTGTLKVGDLVYLLG